jgi:DNA excision repair protein ERCC-1
MSSGSGNGPSNAAPKKPVPPVVVPSLGSNIIINHTQRGNPILECIRNVGKEFSDIPADYQVGRTTGVLYLSLKYHRLHPEYIQNRIDKLGNAYSLRILLLQCDVTEYKEPIRELTKICLIRNITIITAFSKEDSGHYLATFKQFEHKSPDLIKERLDKTYPAILRSALTSINKVNKTDVETLKTTFGSFANIAKASPEQLQRLPGFGRVKVKNILNAMEKPVRNQSTSSLLNTSSQRPGTQVEPSLGTAADLLEKSTTQKNPREKEKVKEKASGDTEESFQPRVSSPDWDIELDLNGSDEEYPS